MFLNGLDVKCGRNLDEDSGDLSNCKAGLTVKMSRKQQRMEPFLREQR